MNGGGAADEHRAAETRRTLFIISLSGFSSTLAMRFFDPMIGVIARDLDADPTRIALLATAYSLPYAFVQPILGPVGDALGKERIMTICLACLAAGLIACALAPNETFLFVFRSLSGAAAGGIIPLALATVGDRVEMAERQVAISRFLIFSISGNLLGGTFAGLFSGLIGWRGVATFGASVAFAAFLAFLFGFRALPRTGAGFTLAVAVERYGRILSLPRALALFAFVFVEGVVIFGVQPFVAPLLESGGQGGALEAGLILTAFALGGVAYTFTVRWLLATFGVRRMLMVAGILAGAAFAVLGTGPSWPVQAGLFFMIGSGFYALHNSYQTQVTELVSDARASAVSLHAFSFFCGQALGPVAIGASLVALGTSRTVELCGFGALALGIVSALILFPRQTRAL